MKRIILSLLVLVACLGLAAHSVGYDEMPVGAKVLPIGVEGTAWGDLEPGVPGGAFYFHDLGNPARWNPTTAVATSTTLYTNLFFHGMVSLNPLTVTLDPALAERWEISEDGQTIVFHLRQGLRWSDGEPFTAADVLFTFNDVIFNEDVTTGARDALRLPDDSYPVIDAPDDYTIQVTTPMPFRPILSAMGQRILPEHKLARFVHKRNPEVDPGTFDTALGLDTDPADIVGMGPYVLDRFVPDQQVVLKRNPYYYVFDAAGTQLPYYDERVALIVPSDDVALLKFINGEIDTFAPRLTDLPFLVGRGPRRGFSTIVDPDAAMYGTSWIGFNQDVGLAAGTDESKRALYRNRTFRQAFSHLLDKEAMIDSVFYGLALPQWSSLSFGSPFYAGRDVYGGPVTEQGAVIYEYDLEQAARMLDGIGIIDRDGDGWRDYENGSRVEITLTTVAGQSNAEGMSIIIVDRARQIGLDVEFSTGDATSVLVSMFTGTFDALILAFTGGNEPNSLASAFDSCGRLHFWRKSACEEPTEVDSELAELFAAGVATLDNDVAFDIYREVQRLIAEDASLLYTAYGVFRYAHYDYVGNAEMANPGGHATGHSGNAVDFIFDRRLLP